MAKKVKNACSIAGANLRMKGIPKKIQSKGGATLASKSCKKRTTKKK